MCNIACVENINAPLVVIIHGNGPDTSKTTLQFELARMLSERGHKVKVSDGSVSQGIFENDLRRFVQGGKKLKTDPMSVCLHVSEKPTGGAIPNLVVGRIPQDWK